MTNVLLLGGTAEARALAQLLVDGGITVTSSLAGRVARPRLPVGEVRVGGFGGVDGLRSYLRGSSVTHVVDATHPFAAGITGNAVAACEAEGIAMLRLERAGWADAPGADRWTWVANHDEAAAAAVERGRRPFLTVGRQPLAAFVGPMANSDALVRVVDEPEIPLPPSWRLLLDRGPYDLAGEQTLMADRDVVVTKDSGGSWTWPKMRAATELGIPVVVVRRPSAALDLSVVREPEQVLDWLRPAPR